jgi:Flp pilus assembly protein TadG
MRLRLLKDENGQVVVLTILSMTMLLGFVALAVDVGVLFNAKRRVQIAADAGAIAAALEASYGSGSATTAAQTAAGNNGITDTTNQVAVHNPPASGYHQSTGFYEVIVNQPNSTAFLNMFVPGQFYVGGRAVAGTIPSPACIYLLDPTVSGALSLQGAGTLTAKNCGIDVNSNSQQAVCLTGGAATVDTPYVRFRATSITTQGNCNHSLATAVYTGNTYLNDPLGIQGPTVPTSCAGGVTYSQSTITSANIGNLPSSGVVCLSSQVTISGTVTLPASAYVFTNGVEISTGAVVTSNGTFIITGGSLKQQGTSCTGSKNVGGFLQDSGSILNLNAPTTGTYKGIALMEPSGVSSPLEVQFGSNSGTYSASSTCSGTSACTGGGGNYACGALCGLIYAPSATVYLHDNGGSATATGVISDTLNICSSDLSIYSYNNVTGSASPLNSVSLVE